MNLSDVASLFITTFSVGALVGAMVGAVQRVFTSLGQ